MGKSKWLWIVCAVASFACILLSVASLVLIADMAEKAERNAERAEDFWEVIDERVDSIERSINIISANVTAWQEQADPDQKDSDDVDADVLFDTICIRAQDGKIAILSADGILLRTLDVNVSTLPDADQAALEAGITVNSWRELIALLEDFE